jgi:hypothetical protein
VILYKDVSIVIYSIFYIYLLIDDQQSHLNKVENTKFNYNFLLHRSFKSGWENKTIREPNTNDVLTKSVYIIAKNLDLSKSSIKYIMEHLLGYFSLKLGCIVPPSN